VPIYPRGKQPLVSTEVEAKWGLIVVLDASEESLIPAANCNPISNVYALYFGLNVAFAWWSQKIKKG
jgi:hypothetical protein